MKLIVDIPEDVYTRLFDNGIQDNEIAVDDICEMARALRLGTPLPKGHGYEVLDKISAEIGGIEINGQVDIHTSFVRTGEHVKQMTLDIIDKYRKEQE